MFSQKKSFFRGKTFLLIIAALLICGYWINQSPDEEKAKKDPAPSLSAQQKDGISGGQDSAKQAVKPKATDEGGYGTPSSGGITDSIDGMDWEGDPTDEETDGSAADSGVTSGVDQQRPEGIDEIDGPYYLIREDAGKVKVYYCEEGTPAKLIRTTDISFPLLSETDQKLFERGVVKQTEDELAELLQDFEG